MFRFIFCPFAYRVGIGSKPGSLFVTSQTELLRSVIYFKECLFQKNQATKKNGVFEFGASMSLCPLHFPSGSRFLPPFLPPTLFLLRFAATSPSLVMHHKPPAFADTASEGRERRACRSRQLRREQTEPR